MSNGRILAVDYGRARIGLAWSDPSRIIVSPLDTLKAAADPVKSAKLFADALSEYEKRPNGTVSQIVVGLPLNMGGDSGAMADEVQKFVDALVGLIATPVSTWDERLTSKQADRALSGRSVKRKQRAKIIDQAAAMLILQSYLDSQGAI